MKPDAFIHVCLQGRGTTEASFGRCAMRRGCDQEYILPESNPCVLVPYFLQDIRDKYVKTGEEEE